MGFSGMQVRGRATWASARFAHLTSPHLTSPRLTSPHVTSRDLTSPHVTSRDLTSPHLTSPRLPRRVFSNACSVVWDDSLLAPSTRPLDYACSPSSMHALRSARPRSPPTLGDHPELATLRQDAGHFVFFLLFLFFLFASYPSPGILSLTWPLIPDLASYPSPGLLSLTWPLIPPLASYPSPAATAQHRVLPLQPRSPHRGLAPGASETGSRSFAQGTSPPHLTLGRWFDLSPDAGRPFLTSLQEPAAMCTRRPRAIAATAPCVLRLSLYHPGGLESHAGCACRGVPRWPSQRPTWRVIESSLRPFSPQYRRRVSCRFFGSARVDLSTCAAPVCASLASLGRGT